MKQVVVKTRGSIPPSRRQQSHHRLPSLHFQAGLKNGVLLAAAEAARFEVLVTTDQEMLHQQNFQGRQISVLVLFAPTNRITDLIPLVPDALLMLQSMGAGQVVEIRKRG